MPEDTFKDHFSTRSADYATYRPTYPASFVATLANLATAHDAALDCGCGNGQLTTMLADHFAQVIGTDASAAQVEQAIPHARVTYRVAPAEASQQPDSSIDLLTVAQAVHWFDLPAFYAEAKRIIKPGGAIAISSYGICTLDGPAGKVFSRFYAETLATFWPPERKLVEGGYRDLPFPFTEITVPATTMTENWTLQQVLGYADTWSAVRNMEKAQGRAGFEEFVAQMSHAWGAPEQTQRISWPIHVRAGRL